MWVDGNGAVQYRLLRNTSIDFVVVWSLQINEEGKRARKDVGEDRHNERISLAPSRSRIRSRHYSTTTVFGSY